MKITFSSLLVLLTFSISAQAQKPILRSWQDKNESLVKLSYFVPEATWSSQFDFTYSTSSGKSKTGGVTNYEVKSKSTEIGAALAYGLNSEINLMLGWQYLMSSENTYDTTPEQTFKYKGAEDPLLALAWRFFKSPENKSAKVIFAYSPSTGKTKGASATEDGNALRGGDYAYVTGVFTAEMSPATEVSVFVQRSHSFESKSEADTVRDPYGATILSAKILHDTDGGFYLGGGLTIGSVDARSSKSSTGAKSESGAYTATVLEVDVAADLDANNGLSGALVSALPFSYKSDTDDIENNQSLSLKLGWTHQF